MPLESARHAWHALLDWFAGAVLSVPFVVAVLGQFAYHLREVRYSERGPPLYVRMLWGVPSAFIMGQLAGPVAKLAGIPGAENGVAGVLGYYGLAGMHAMALMILRRRQMAAASQKGDKE